jgi:hypothetical protein
LEIVNPGTFSTSRMLIPAYAGSAAGSVLHSSATSPARRALVIHVFDPLIT